MKTTLTKQFRGSRKAFLVLLALGGTMAAAHTAPVQGVRSVQVASLTAPQPSMGSFFAVGGVSLLGMLALRRRVRGSQA
ncbi:MAG TPA: hypothetical protein VGD78_15115 [Chthoniobacterales bacterium]